MPDPMVRATEGPLAAAARAVAVRAHAGQADKAGRPYIDHPARVAARLEAEGMDDATVAAGWLHDVLEDTEVTPDDLREHGFPEYVITAVVALTHLPDEPSEAYYARVRADPIALRVKRADLGDNSDPARLLLLDEATRERLTAKYAYARARLGSA